VNWKKNSRPTLSVICLLGLACSPADRRLSLRDSVEPPAVPLSPEAARLRQLQLVRFVNEDGSRGEVTANDFGLALSECGQFSECNDPGLGVCAEAACWIKTNQCQAELMLAIASGTGSAITLNLNYAGGPHTVPPQTAATNAALAEWAAKRFQEAMRYSTDVLTGVFPTPRTPLCQNLTGDSVYSGGRPLGDFAAAAFIDALHEGKRAFHVAYQNTLAVSDAELSNTTSLELGRLRAISNERLSRTAAAHLMVPGALGWLGSTSQAFCTSGRLTGPQEAALSVLREAAPAPSDVLATETEVLLHGLGTQPPFGSVRERLEDAWGVGALPANRPIWEPYGLTDGDFVAAHAALKDEIQIFSRSQSATLAPRRIPGGASPQFERFAGTAGRAPERPDPYWAMLSQIGAPESPVPAEFWRVLDDGSYDYFGTSAGGVSRLDQPAGSLAEFVEVAYAWARVITQTPAVSAFQTTVINPLQLVLTGEDTRGRLTHCVSTAGGGVQHRIEAAGFHWDDRLALVRGEDLMECLVRGHVEGGACPTLPTLLRDLTFTSSDVNEDFSVIRLNYENPFDFGPYASVAWTDVVAPSNVPPSTLGRYYLIRPRLKGNDSPRPGEWELLLGAPLAAPPSVGAAMQCRVIPIVPEATAAAAAAIAPSRDWCGTSEVSCAGTRFDERLPLEDELTGDGDDVESSWKHYLGLARSAVDQADALGQEYLEASLQEELRTEEVEIRRDQQEEKAMAAFQRVQEICGSAVKPETVLFLLGFDTNGNLNLNDIGGAQCTSTPTDPWICGVRRLLDQNPELGELRECLGLLGARQEMHLGDGFLCVAEHESCEDEDSMPPCMAAGQPFVYTAENCQACDPALYHCLLPDDGLKLFETESLKGTPALPELCEGLQRLRAGPTGGESDRARLLEAVKGHDLLSPDNIAGLHVQSKLNYEPASGSYMTLSVGPTWNVTSKQGSELCGTVDTECPAGKGGLFCKSWNCNDPARQGDLNLRLYRAALALMNAIPDAESGQSPPPPLRVDTVWYLNYYLQPNRAWGERSEQGQWRLFDRAGETERNPVDFGNTLIPVPANVSAPVFLGQAWNTQGPLPDLRTFGDNAVPPMSSLPVQNNRQMQLALRNAYLANRAKGGLRLDLLDLPAANRVPTGSVSLVPHVLSGRTSEGENLVGLGLIQKQYTDSNCAGCIHVADLNHNNVDLRSYDGYVGSNGSGSTGFDRTTLKQAIEARGLMLFAPPSVPASGWVEVAPAATKGESWVFDTVFGVQQFPPPPTTGATTKVTLDDEAELDAIELVCRGLDGTWAPLEQSCDDDTPINTFGDTARAGRRLQCLGNQLKTRAATAVYLLPEKAIEYLRNGERVYDATGGALHVAISDLRNSLLQASLSAPAIGGTLERFGADMTALHARLAQTDIAEEIAKVQLYANIAQQTTNCLTSVTDTVGMDPLRAAGQAAGAVVTCVNSLAQIAFSSEITRLTQASQQHESREALAEFSGRTSDYVTTLSAESVRLSQALEGIQRNLEVIEGLQSEGLRAIQAAAWHLSTQSFNQGAITRTISNLKVGKGIRYQRAFDNAKKMAFLAKRSIEMRLGMSLADMVQDLPLVAAPATWEGTVCQATGINYASLGQAGGGETFADAFLGDYVTKLEQVIESYRLVNNFHEGRDTVVVSLRDDIHNTRARCATESRNLLYWASDLSPVTVVRPGERPSGWTQTGCVMESAEDEDGPYERPAGDCIIVRQKDGTPFFDPILGVRPVPAWDLEFGLSSACASSCAYQPGAAIAQDVDVEPGRYRFSWYTTSVEGSAGTSTGRVWASDGFEIPANVDPAGAPTRTLIEGLDGDWNRMFFEFDVFGSTTIRVGFERPSAAEPVVSVAAPMLEKLSDPEHQSTLRTPSAFTDTTWELVSRVPVCEDTTGKNFRAEKWHRHCQKLCPDGYASDCADQARTECYWETSFHVSQRSIEAGHMFNQSGFARGNYNYRLQSLGLNFVGTNLRACDGSSLPSTCNAAGYIPYSVIHEGPYYVRNHKGQDYRAALFPGRIEHARGLGVERYISNPLGEADRTLIEPYMRPELMGRPLDGEFIIRVWDEDGVNFNAIEDVQLVIDYGYWTRFN
jgi:hypothetical protein